MALVAVSEDAPYPSLAVIQLTIAFPGKSLLFDQKKSGSGYESGCRWIWPIASIRISPSFQLAVPLSTVAG